jgi:hypothetical protein
MLRGIAIDGLGPSIYFLGFPMLILPTTANVSDAEAAGEQFKYRTIHLSMAL